MLSIPQESAKIVPLGVGFFLDCKMALLAPYVRRSILLHQRRLDIIPRGRSRSLLRYQL
jgi:hypothetical protein